MPRPGKLLVLAVALSLLIVSTAAASTRYAAPGGTGADPCVDPSDPCSLFTAADGGAPGTSIQAGDVVELAPGTYSEMAADLGPSNFIQPPVGVTVRGEPGAARPVINLEANSASWGAFFLGSDAELADVEIRNQAASGSALAVLDGVMERVVARSTASTGFTCNFFQGTMRSSACINAAGGTAIGVSVATAAGVHASVIRNSSAIATGPGSVGMNFAYFASENGVVGSVDAIGVIAKGETKDVIAQGLEFGGSGKGATTNIELQASDYATSETKTSGSGTASVTAPGTNGNIIASPLLAADGIHQLTGSPTIDKGAVDGASGTLDVDGQLRTIGVAPDIGADEMGNPTKISIGCSSFEIPIGTIGGKPICTIRVEDIGTADQSRPTGELSLSMSPGSLSQDSCTLLPDAGFSSSCLESFLATVGDGETQTLTVSYKGDSSHEGSEASAVFSVFQVQPGGAGGGGGGDEAGGAGQNPSPQTKLEKHPSKRTKKRLAKFTFGSNEAGSRFECKLDRKPFRVCVSPFKREVKLGGHKFQVRAIDVQGKADPTPAVFRWRVIAP